MPTTSLALIPSAFTLALALAAAAALKSQARAAALAGVGATAFLWFATYGALVARIAPPVVTRAVAGVSLDACERAAVLAHPLAGFTVEAWRVHLDETGYVPRAPRAHQIICMRAEPAWHLVADGWRGVYRAAAAAWAGRDYPVPLADREARDRLVRSQVFGGPAPANPR